MHAPDRDPAAGAKIAGKVWDVDTGTGTQVIAVALGVTTKQGAALDQHYLIMRGTTTIAEARLTKVSDHMSYAAIIKGSLRDVGNDVREGDQAVLAP